MAPLSVALLQPLGSPVFRRIWTASLLSNLGLLIQSVGAAWAMTQLDGRPEIVALVQTALMAPMMLLSIPAGALADMFDRRRVALAALAISLTGAALLTGAAHAALLTPALLLALCFLIGSGGALFSPAWQASVGEQVSGDDLPSAVALNGISYNVARSFGPALGGLVVAIGGSVAAFLCNALFYLPILLVLATWRRTREVSRLPPERLREAVTAGLRYVLNAPAIRTLLSRSLVVGLAGSAIHALLPLVARDMLHGDARTYGVLLGCFGVGAVLGAAALGMVRARLSAEQAALLSALLVGGAQLVVAFSPSARLTAPALVAGGVGWTLALTQFNIGVQLAAPRWVMARAVASWQTAITGGIAIGSWFWGSVAGHVGIRTALLCAAGVMLLSPLLRWWLPVPEVDRDYAEAGAEVGDPEVALRLTPRSGPVVIEIDYRVDPERARDFYRLMQDLRLSRRRNGAQIWSIARDVADPQLWTERFHCATWLDYLRHRNRPTAAERELVARALAFHLGPGPVHVRRLLERPFGSVRWREDTPDRGAVLVPGAGAA